MSKNKKETVWQQTEPAPPPTKSGRPKGSGIKWRFDIMKVGDSKVITYKEKMSVYSCVKSYNKTHGTSIKVQTGKDSKGELRVWRVE